MDVNPLVNSSWRDPTLQAAASNGKGRMTFDFGTLTIAGGLVAFVSGLLLIFAWNQYGSGGAALRLSLSHLVGATAITLLAFGALSRPIVPTLVQSAFVLAAFLALSSILAFEKRERRLPLFFSAAACLVIIACLMTAIQEAGTGRLFQLAMTSTLYLISGWVLWQGKKEQLAARIPLVAILLLHGLMNSVGLAEAVLSSSLPLGVPSFSEWYGLVHLESMLYFIGSTLFMVALLKERSEAKHKIASLTDSLTGLANRRAYFDGCDRMLEYCRRTHAPCTVLAIDMDRFKAINDTFGHGLGDRVLELFAQVARAELRSSDIVGRVGGEEFAVLLPRTHSREAAEIAHRIRDAFSGAAYHIGEHEVGGTLSIGVAVVLSGEYSISEALNRADAALYRAKLKGRNRVEVDTGVQSIRFTGRRAYRMRAS